MIQPLYREYEVAPKIIFSSFAPFLPVSDGIYQFVPVFPAFLVITVFPGKFYSPDGNGFSNQRSRFAFVHVH